jgi:hypothetical protein
MNPSGDQRVRPWKAIYTDACRQHNEKFSGASNGGKCSQVTGFAKGQIVMSGGQDGASPRLLIDMR